MCVQETLACVLKLVGKKSMLTGNMAEVGGSTVRNELLSTLDSLTPVILYFCYRRQRVVKVVCVPNS